MRFKFIRTQNREYPKEVMLRWETLLKPLGLPPSREILSEEENSLHLIAIEDKKVVGCLLFHPETQTTGELFQLAVSEEYRGQGFRRKMMLIMERALYKLGIDKISLYSTEEWVSFYRQMGYTFNGTPIKKRELFYQPMTKILK